MLAADDNPVQSPIIGTVWYDPSPVMHSTRNEASCRVAAGAQFLAEGTKRSACLHLDGWHDMHLHARVNDRADRDPFR